MNHGKIAYEAYCEVSGNKSLISGAELPAWGDLKLEIQRAWTAAGEAVAQAAYEKSVELTQAARRGFESVQHKD